MRGRCGILLLAALALAGSLPAATLYVDDDAPSDPGPFDRRISDPGENGSAERPFDSIQQAIDAAAEGDTVIVAPGHYLSPDPWDYDEIGFKGKNIRLIGSAPTDFSVIEQTVLCGVVIFWGTEDANCLLQGFKIQNHSHGGILGCGTAATISHCIISGNGPCGGTVLKDCRGRIANCLIVDNSTFHACGLMPVVSGCVELVNCTIANNISGIGIPNEGLDRSIVWPIHGGALVFGANVVVIHNCIIYGNQGPQIVQQSSPALDSGSALDIGSSVVEDWSELWRELRLARARGVQEGDPCFVRPGYWVGETLVEGDYHLQSEGYRWSDQQVHGSHWYFDFSTSPAIDAGDPMDGLGEELERAPQDPEGRWGVNHAINLGAYGGTNQASLAPNRDSPPGVGTVDLRDYWPFAEGNAWRTSTRERWRGILIAERRDVNGVETYTIAISPSQVVSYCVFIGDALYVTGDAGALDRLPQIAEPLRMQYPRYLPVGSTIEVQDDLFATRMPSRRFITIVRGSLEEVYAGTSYPSTKYLSGSWPDVIALRSQNADGTLGEPIAIFARGFGPLLLNSQPTDLAEVDGIAFPPSPGSTTKM